MFMQGGGVLEAPNGSEGHPHDHQDGKMPDDSERELQESARSSLIVSAFNSSVAFWLQTFFAPGLQVWPCAITWFLSTYMHTLHAGQTLRIHLFHASHVCKGVSIALC